MTKMKSKFINGNECSQKPISELIQIKNSSSNTVYCIADDKRITKLIIFPVATEINPTFHEGTLEDWKLCFIMVFKIDRFCLSKNKVYKQLEKEMAKPRVRVKRVWMPFNQHSSTTAVMGMNMLWTLTMFLLGRSIENYIWGKEDSGNHSVNIGSKEKDWLTIQLAVTKGKESFLTSES